MMANQQTEIKKSLLEVIDFSLSFRQYEKGLHEKDVKVIQNLNVTVHEGEVLAIVGASGSGKSLLASAVLGLLPENANWNGVMNYKGQPLTKDQQVFLRGKEIVLVPQSINALDPLMKVAKQVQATIQTGDKQTIQQSIFEKIGLPPKSGKKYPFELSGGMARRVLAATALARNAQLVIADEPTPGLDPAVLNETAALLKQLAADGKGVMLITHDIETALKIADRVAVFYKGETVEVTSVDNFTGKGEKLKNAYTRRLWNALPQNDFASASDFQHSVHDLSNQVRRPRVGTVKGVDEQLEINSISYRYHRRDHYLFKKLTMTLNPGEVVGLYGFSGSGKTTMAKIMAGYMKAEEGEVKINGKPISSFKRSPVQLIWQHPEKAVNPRWKMNKVLAEGQMLDSELTKILGIEEEWLRRWPSELSGGELQRFCIARALDPDTKYIIADEITTMLDAVTQAHMWRTLLKLAKERGIGILAISHDYHLLRRISDQIINFNDIANIRLPDES